MARDRVTYRARRGVQAWRSVHAEATLRGATRGGGLVLDGHIDAPLTKMRRPEESLSGVLVVDKPIGPTSHDVVARVRRALGTRRVGHAGTLDPAASGVLVVLVGEATKLSPYLTAHHKAYAATVTLGTATSTWDAQGDTVATGPLPDDLARELAALAALPEAEASVAERTAPLLHAALAAEHRRTAQTPPSFSAIKLQGRAAYELARRGMDVELAPRPVEVLGLDVLRVTEHGLDVVLRVAKGYYVRAFAHDLGVRLGVPAHLGALRRLSSGPFSIDEACAAWQDGPSARAQLQPVVAAVKRAMPFGVLSHAGAVKAGHGQALGADDFVERPVGSPAAWLDGEGRLVAVGAETDGAYRAVRGFAQVTSSDDT